MGVSVRREEIAAAEPQWRAMLPSLSLPAVFLSPVWLKTWWAEFAVGRELILLSARDGEKFVGVVPLMRDGDILSFAGDTQICDYMDFGALPGHEPDVISGVLRSISEEPWRELVLWAVPEHSPTLALLPGLCREMGLGLEVRQEDVCPQVELPGDWEEYMARLDKKDRHELRRKLRRLPQAGNVELKVIDSPSEVAGALDTFFPLYSASRPEKAAFLSAPFESFLRRLAPALAGEGMAEMAFLQLNQRPVAAVLCFRTNGQLLLYNSGYDPAYGAFSVGLLAKALVLNSAIERGLSRFDFLRGPEPYKYDLGAKDVKVFRCVIKRA